MQRVVGVVRRGAPCLHKLMVSKLGRHLVDEPQCVLGLEHRLKVRHALIGAQRMQRRVIPSELVQWTRRLRARDRACDLAAALLCEPAYGTTRRRRTLHSDHVAPLAIVREALVCPLHVRCVHELVVVQKPVCNGCCLLYTSPSPRDS